MTDAPARSMTLADFDALLSQPQYAARRLELIGGQVVEKMSPTEEHAFIAAVLVGELYTYLRHNPVGRVTTEARHHGPEDTRDSRLPDVAFTRRERALPLVREGAVPQMPDLAVEIRSPGDTLLSLREKALYYLTRGAQEVWLVLPRSQQIEIHRGDAAVRTLGLNDTLSAGDLLPGFTLAVAQVFREDT